MHIFVMIASDTTAVIVFSSQCRIVCPDGVGAGVTLWTIISKVRLEAFMWVR